MFCLKERKKENEMENRSDLRATVNKPDIAHAKEVW
jgi:hypothetical protein